MSLPPTAAEKGLVLNTRTGALYGAAGGFLIGLIWQAIAGYTNPIPLWRWLIVAGALLGGSFGFGYARAKATRAPESEEPRIEDRGSRMDS